MHSFKSGENVHLHTLRTHFYNLPNLFRAYQDIVNILNMLENAPKGNRRFIVSHSIIDVAPILAGILPSKIGANKVARQTAGIPLAQQFF